MPQLIIAALVVIQRQKNAAEHVLSNKVLGDAQNHEGHHTKLRMVDFDRRVDHRFVGPVICISVRRQK